MILECLAANSQVTSHIPTKCRLPPAPLYLFEPPRALV